MQPPLYQIGSVAGRISWPLQVAFRESFGDTRAAMRRPGRIFLAVAMILLPAVGRAQSPFDPSESPRAKLRDRANRGQTTGPKVEDQVKKLASEDPAERIEGVRGLSESTDAKAAEYLIGAANDPDERVRVKAIDTLGQQKSKDAVPLLVQKLFLRDTDQSTKAHILAALGKIGDERATSPLLDLLSRDGDRRIWGNAVYALGEIGDARAIPGLEKLAASTDDEAIRVLATDTARKIRERPAPVVQPPALATDRRGPGAARP
jgi:HEAT repeat protein